MCESGNTRISLLKAPGCRPDLVVVDGEVLAMSEGKLEPLGSLNEALASGLEEATPEENPELTEAAYAALRSLK